jgi:hypothetical protein
MQVDGFGAPVGGRTTVRVVRRLGGVRDIVPLTQDADDQLTFTNRYEAASRLQTL